MPGTNSQNEKKVEEETATQPQPIHADDDVCAGAADLVEQQAAQQKTGNAEDKGKTGQGPPSPVLNGVESGDSAPSSNLLPPSPATQSREKSTDKFSSLPLHSEPDSLVELDQVLPSEVLTHIAAFLHLSDFHSLVSVSQTAKWKLERFRRSLAKPTVTLEVWKSDEKRMMRVRIEREPEERVIEAELEDTHNMREEGEEELRQEMLDLYYSKENDPLVERAQRLYLHLQFLSSRARIRRLELAGFNDVQLLEVCQMIRDKRVRVDDVTFERSPYRQLHTDIILLTRACGLTLREMHLPDGLLCQPHFRKIRTLDIDYCDFSLPLETMASLNRVEQLRLKGTRTVSIEMIKMLIQQWLNSEREINRYDLFASIDGDVYVSWLDQLQNSVIEVRDLGVSLRRITDGKIIMIDVNHYCCRLLCQIS